MKHRGLSIAGLLGATLLTSAPLHAVPVQWSSGVGGNDHWYEVLSLTQLQNPSWQNARTAALARSHLGMAGYLATVTSAAENAFLTSLSGAVGYLGGSDETTEGTWRWVDGPEAGQAFWINGVTQPGFFANWNGGEPNNSGNEDYVHTNFILAGGWNDIPNTGSTSVFFVEYGPMPPPVVPEPVTLGLLGLGLLGVGVASRRRRSQS